jgi:xylulose-5-phosphate/fructose-6-phosphate phosphoketolase
VIVADKKVHLQYLDMEAAVEHCTKGPESELGQQ